jgi:small subunit ribosomal protein S1
MTIIDQTSKPQNDDLQKLLTNPEYTQLPHIGDVVEGIVLSASKHEVKLDLGGFKVGVVRGNELYNESEEYGNLKPGDAVIATVLEEENENGELELSFRYAAQKRAWATLLEHKESGQPLEVKIIDANKGGLIIRSGHVIGFLPVSQLTPEHYPRVPGGDKSRILDELRRFAGKNLKVVVLDADEKEDKLIVSEKDAWKDKQESLISQYKVGSVVEGKVTAVTDFGVFVKFDNNLEGLIHISEIAWQRIDNPRDFVKVGDVIKAEIINIDGAKIFLSMKKLQQDPWHNIEAKYKVGDVVKGKVLKVNPFGLFVELDQDIHGLAHISELSDRPIESPNAIAKIGDVIDFKILSIIPSEHRLGLSLRALKEKKEPVKKETEPRLEDPPITANQEPETMTTP